MARSLHRGLTPGRLRLVLGLLFVALVAPSVVLIVQTQRQIKWEAFHQYRTLADELAVRIDAQLQRVMAAEEARAFTDYQFVVVAGNPKVSNFLQRSSLAQYPVASDVPGLVGYFQVDADGAFSTPLLPEALSDPSQWGFDATELANRRAVRDNLLDVLSRNQLVERHYEGEQPAAKVETIENASIPSIPSTADTAGKRSSPAPAPAPTVDAVSDKSSAAQASAAVPDAVAEKQVLAKGQQAFDQLNTPSQQKLRAESNEYDRLDELRLQKNYQDANAQREAQAPPLDYEQRQKSNAPVRATRKEQSAVVEGSERASNVEPNVAAHKVRMFESEVDPFEFALLDSGHGVLYRKVWRNGQRIIQGAIVDQAAFLQGAIATPFLDTALAQMSDLRVAYQHDVVLVTRGTTYSGFSSSSAGELNNELLYQVHLSAPLGDFQLLWTINRLPAGPGARVVGWASIVLFGVLVLGFLALYWLGMRQIVLSRQQQDFVSAVSHELKTPLTSIRMYAEMLREGWANDDKKREYYHFIHDESERLSRLIANVLQLARMERNDLRLEPKAVAVSSLMDMLRSKVHTQIERANFECTYTLDPACAERMLEVDADAFVQIIINLVDNAIKFSARAERRALEIGVHARGDRAVVWSVRDYGPGVPKAQMKKIFQLFYRSGNELTRETLGTGIGLALVRQLARAMNGDVDVINREPGAEFQLRLNALP